MFLNSGLRVNTLLNLRLSLLLSSFLKKTFERLNLRQFLFLVVTISVTSAAVAETIPLPAGVWNADWSNTKHTIAVEGCAPAEASRNAALPSDPVNFTWVSSEKPPNNVAYYGTRPKTGQTKTYNPKGAAIRLLLPIPEWI